MSALSVPTFYGGKHAGQGTRGTGQWIASLLPWASDAIYVEPMCGMCGILLQRPPMAKEIINDLDGHVTNLWRVVRHGHKELERLCDATPLWSRPDFDEAWELLESNVGDPALRAWSFLVVSSWSLMQARRPFTYPKMAHQSAQARRLSAHPWGALAVRMANVQVEECGAIDLMSKLADNEHVIGYADPPYRYADTRPYGATVDHDALEQVLLAQRGRWAVSGYEEDFPGLDAAGWTRHERTTWLATAISTESAAQRTECLWTNYQSGQGTLW